MPWLLVASALLANLSFTLSLELSVTNVAVGKKCSASSFEPGYPPGNAVTEDQSPCFKSKDTGAGQWWEVDLGRIFPVSSLFMNREAYGGPSYYVTVDGQPCANVSFGWYFRFACSSVIYGRKVRFTSTEAGQLDFCRVQVYMYGDIVQCEPGRWGTDCQCECSDDCSDANGISLCYQPNGACYEENVARGKPVNTSSSGAYWPPNVANNGDVKNCFYGIIDDDNDDLQWWEVDLGDNYLVHQMEVWPDDAGFPFTITVDGRPCFSNSVQYAGAFALKCDFVMCGRVVRISRTDPGPISLCEFIVTVPMGLTSCPRYGPGCANTCPSQCTNNDQTTSHCYETTVNGKDNTCKSPFPFGPVVGGVVGAVVLLVVVVVVIVCWRQRVKSQN